MQLNYRAMKTFEGGICSGKVKCFSCLTCIQFVIVMIFFSKKEHS